MQRFKPIPPEPRRMREYAAQNICVLLGDLADPFRDARVKYGLSSKDLAKQMIEYCLKQLEEENKDAR